MKRATTNYCHIITLLFFATSRVIPMDLTVSVIGAAPSPKVYTSDDHDAYNKPLFSFLAEYENFDQTYQKLRSKNSENDDDIAEMESDLLLSLQSLHAKTERIDNYNLIDADDIISKAYDSFVSWNEEGLTKIHQNITSIKDEIFNKIWMSHSIATTITAQQSHELLTVSLDGASHTDQQLELIATILGNVASINSPEKNAEKSNVFTEIKQNIQQLINCIQQDPHNTCRRVQLLTKLLTDKKPSEQIVNNMAATIGIVRHITQKKLDQPNNFNASAIAYTEQITNLTHWPVIPLDQVTYISLLPLLDDIKTYLFQLMWWSIEQQKNCPNKKSVQKSLYRELWLIRNKGEIKIQRLIPQPNPKNQKFPLFYSHQNCGVYQKNIREYIERITEESVKTAYANFLESFNLWVKNSTPPKTLKPTQYKKEREPVDITLKQVQTSAAYIPSRTNDDDIDIKSALDMPNPTPHSPTQTTTTTTTTTTSRPQQLDASATTIDSAAVEKSLLSLKSIKKVHSPTHGQLYFGTPPSSNVDQYVDALHTLALHIQQTSNAVTTDIKTELNNDRHAQLLEAAKKSTMSNYQPHSQRFQKLKDACEILGRYPEYKEFTWITNEIYNNRDTITENIAKPFYVAFNDVQEEINTAYPRTKGDKDNKHRTINTLNANLLNAAQQYWQAEYAISSWREIPEKLVINLYNPYLPPVPYQTCKKTAENYINKLKSKVENIENITGFFSTLFSYFTNKKVINNFESAKKSNLLDQNQEDIKDLNIKIQNYRQKTWWTTAKETFSWWRSFLPF